MCKWHKELFKSGAQELVRDLQHTHKTETITQHVHGLGLIQREYFTESISNKRSPCYIVGIFLTCELDGPCTFHASSTPPLLALPLFGALGHPIRKKQPHIQRKSPTGISTHLRSEWLVNFSSYTGGTVALNWAAARVETRSPAGRPSTAHWGWTMEEF